MMSQTTNTDSTAILHLIEEGTIGAEIGIWEGSTSAKLIKKKLKKFYMVDPYSIKGYVPAAEANDPTFSYEKYYQNYARMTGGSDPDSFNRYYDQVYNRVVKKFGGRPEVEIVRKNSTEWFNEFDGEKLDWIYVDGDHSYTGVINDLNNCLKVVKKGGIIIGDDYKWGRDGDKGGVKKAVNEFVEKNNYELVRHGMNQFSIEV